MLPLAPLIDPNFDKLWAVTSSLENIIDLLSGFSYWNISIVKRDLNSTDRMAKPNGLHLQLGWVNLQLLPDLVCFANAGVG